MADPFETGRFGGSQKTAAVNSSSSGPDEEYEDVPPMCDECYRIIGPNDGARCPVCGTPFDGPEDDREDWRDEAFDDEFYLAATPHKGEGKA